ncbi:MAG: hypothetical protein ACOYL3_25720 [Desulfuromonadaceae bacterium]
MNEAAKLRLALAESLPTVDQAGSADMRDPAFTFLPPSHAKALDVDSSIVEGIRGSGKSFWWGHLASDAHRRYIETAYPDVRLGSAFDAVQAFGAQSVSTQSPSQDVLSALLKTYSARAIWRAVLAHSAGFGAPFPASGQWTERVRWVVDHPEEYDDLLRVKDAELDEKGRTIVVLFDALDRLADEWNTIRPLARALLQLALDVRSTRRIRFKVFLRPDMLQDREIIGFPDASKLLARKAELRWQRADLYALMFQCAGNATEGGEAFRRLAEEAADQSYTTVEKVWLLPRALRTDEKLQERLFERLAGNAMASGPSGYKRGKPYTWLVNHLVDGLGQVSPRSYCEAVRHAAQNSPAETQTALHFRAIQSGVQAASKIRVNEVTTEDYPWIDFVMQPLRGKLTVPCAAEDFERLWLKDQTIEQLEARLGQSSLGAKLPPQSLSLGADGVLADLEALGLIERLRDGRIQMPDVYRIGFGFGRRGGVKPLK